MYFSGLYGLRKGDEFTIGKGCGDGFTGKSLSGQTHGQAVGRFAALMKRVTQSGSKLLGG
ncbi:hypothetical protein GCM10028818_03520 [Spirosoma horti]